MGRSGTKGYSSVWEKTCRYEKLKNSAFFVDKPWYGWEVGGLFPVILSACFRARF